MQFLVLCRDAKNYKRVVKLIKKRYRESGHRAGIPTFSEFVEYLIDARTKRPFTNRHWKPFHELCKPCQVRYNFIGHLETIRQDAVYLLKKIGLEDAKLVYMHPSTKKASSLVAEEMATLSEDQLARLKEIYQFDFELFGYSTDLQSLR